MSNTNNLPLDLYKANLELQTRISKLFQEGGKQWLDYGHRLVDDGIAETQAEIEQLLQSKDWQKLATLPAESFWRQVQQRFGDSQAVAQIAITAQTEFARGLQEAIETWQKETSQVIGGSPLTQSPAATAWTDLVKSWESFLPGASTVGQAAAKKAKSGK